MSSNYKTKIALYTPSFPPKDGGIATIHYNLYLLLKDIYNIQIFVFDDYSNNNNPSFHYRVTPPWFKRIVTFFVNIYFKKYNHNNKLISTTAILFTLYPIWKLNRPLKKFKPAIIIISDHYVPSYALKKPKGSKLIWYSHHNYFRFRNNPFFNQDNIADNDICRSMEHKALMKADAVICPSNYMIEEYRKAYDHEVPITLINNFISKKEIEKIKVCNPFESINSEIPIVYIPSAGSEVKGKRYTFEIVRRISEYFKNKVAFYLSGNIPEDLKIELSSIGNPNIFMPGNINWVTNIAYVKCCKIGISPTLAENFSAAIIEGNINGIPFIAFDTGGNKEIIKDGQTGYLVPFLHIESLISKGINLIENNEILQNFKSNVMNWSRELLDQDKIITTYNQLFFNLING